MPEEIPIDSLDFGSGSVDLADSEEIPIDQFDFGDGSSSDFTAGEEISIDDAFSSTPALPVVEEPDQFAVASARMEELAEQHDNDRLSYELSLPPEQRDLDPLPEYDGNLLTRTLKGGRASFEDAFWGLLGRAGIADKLPGMEDFDIDQYNRDAAFRDQQLAIGDKDGVLGERVSRAVRNAGSSVLGGAPAAALGGAPLLIGQFALDSANKSYTEAIDAGLEDSDAAKHAVLMGSIEGGITALAGKLGQGGLESLMAGRLRGLSQLSKSMVAELAEENAIAAASMIAEAFNGVQELPDAKEAASQFLDTSLASLIAVGSVGGSQAAADYIANPSRSNAKKAGIPAELSGPKASRAELAEQAKAVIRGIEGDTNADASGLPISQATSNKIKSWLKENFWADGLQNETISTAVRRRDGKIAKHAKRAEFLSKRVQRAVKSETGGSTKESAEYLNEALQNPVVAAQLPTSVALPLQEMRDHIDSLSREVQQFVEDGSDLDFAIDENMGVYLTRTYRKFTSPSWKDVALNDPQIMTEFADEVRTESPDATDAEIRTLAERLLNRHTRNLSDLASVSPRTRDYTKILKARKLDSPAIRKLYGENKDAFVNYTTSVSKMSQLVAHKQMAQDIREVGLEAGFFSKRDELSNPSHTQQVNHEQIPHLAGYSDLFMDEDIAKGLDNLYTTAQVGIVPQIAIGVSAYTKSAATVQSWTATNRNLVGGLPIAVANGTWNPAKLLESGKVVWGDDVGMKRLLGRETGSEAEIERLTELGLLEDVTIASLQDAAKQMAQPLQSKASDFLDKLSAKKALKSIAKFYQSMDSVRKVATFYDQKPRYAEAFPEMTESEVEEYVAKIIRDTDPTYDRASKAVKYWSRYVPFGPFAVFNAEMIRTTVNRLRLTAQEINSENPKLRAIGQRRAIGQLAALTVPTAITAALHAALGVDDEEVEAVRQRMAPWSRNSDIAVYHVDKEKGKIGVMDLSFTDPFGIAKKPLIAMLRGEWEQAVGEASDFLLGEDIAAGAFVSLLRNKDANGRQVYDEGAGADQQYKQIADYMAKRFLPGTVRSLQRIADSAADKKTIEIVSFFTGFRASPFEIEKSDYYRNREFAGRMQETNAAINRAIKYGDPANLAEFVASAEQKRREAFDEWTQYLEGSKVLGQENVLQLLRQQLQNSRGGSRQLANQVYANTYKSYRPSSQTLSWLRKQVVDAKSPEAKQQAQQRLDATMQLFISDQ